MRRALWTLAACAAVCLAFRSPGATLDAGSQQQRREHQQFEWPLSLQSAVRHLAVGRNGDIVVTGDTWDAAFPTTPDAVQTACSRAAFGYCFSPFLSVLSPTGDVQYSTFIGGDSERPIVQAKPDADGDIVLLLGRWESGNMPHPRPSLVLGEPPSPTGCSRDRPLLARLRPGDHVYHDQRCLEWPGLEFVTQLRGVVGHDGSVWLAGRTSGPVPTVNAWQPAGAGGDDVFIVHYGAARSDAALATYVGGSDQDWPMDLAVAPDGDLVVAGGTMSADFPAVRPAQDGFSGAGFGVGDACLFRLDVSGRWLEYSTWLGGSGQDGATAVSTDRAGNAFVVGVTASTDFPVTAGAVRTRNAPAGTWDAFLAGVDPTGRLRLSTLIGASGQDDADAVSVWDDGSVLIVGETTSIDLPQVGPVPHVQPARPPYGFPFFVRVDSLGCAFCRSTPIPVHTGHLADLDDQGAALSRTLEAVAFDGDYVYVAGRTAVWTWPGPDIRDTGHYVKKWYVGEESSREPPANRR